MLNRKIYRIYTLLLFFVSLFVIILSIGNMRFNHISLILGISFLLLIVDYFDLYNNENIYFSAGLKMIMIFISGWEVTALISSVIILINFIVKKKRFEYDSLYLFSKEYISIVVSGWLLIKMFPTVILYSETPAMLTGASLFLILIVGVESLFKLIVDLIISSISWMRFLNWVGKNIFVSLLSILFSFISFFLWFNGDYLISFIFILFSLLFIVMMYLKNRRYNEVIASLSLVNNISTALSDAKRTEGLDELSELLFNNETVKNLVSGYYYIINAKKKHYEKIERFKYVELINTIKTDLRNTGHISKEKIEKEYKDIMVIDIEKSSMRGIICLIIKHSNDSVLSRNINVYINDYFEYIFDNIEVRDKLDRDYSQTIEAIVTLVETRDPPISGHSNRVAYYSYMIGKLLGFTEKDLNDLRISGYLHDIGMINVPESIIRKPAALSIKEFEEIKKHPITGYNLISNIKHLKNVLPGILQHHERINGSGYPYGLKYENISLQGRIIAIADTFDAMLSKRAYRMALSLEFTLEYLSKKSGILYDRDIYNVFLKGIRENKIKIIRRNDDIVY